MLVAVGVLVGDNVGVGDGVGVGESVGVDVGVLVGVEVGIAVAVGVLVSVAVAVGTDVLVGDEVGVGVGLGVLVGSGVGVVKSVGVGGGSLAGGEIDSDTLTGDGVLSAPQKHAEANATESVMHAMRITYGRGFMASPRLIQGVDRHDVEGVGRTVSQTSAMRCMSCLHIESPWYRTGSGHRLAAG